MPLGIEGIHDSVESDGIRFLVLELVEGLTLAEPLESDARAWHRPSRA